jgi:hypothetical protein
MSRIHARQSLPPHMRVDRRAILTRFGVKSASKFDHRVLRTALQAARGELGCNADSLPLIIPPLKIAQRTIVALAEIVLRFLCGLERTLPDRINGSMRRKQSARVTK